MKVAVILARGGSKRIPRKNVREFCGQPMIAWPIAAAKACGLFDRIIVSTDDKKIAKTAESQGAEVPFMRPAELADDHSGTGVVMRHAIHNLRAIGYKPDLVCCLYATAAFITADDLTRLHAALLEKQADFAFPVLSYAYPPQCALRLDSQQRPTMVHPEHRGDRSQDLETRYHDAGQCYWGRTEAWLEDRRIFDRHSVVEVLPRSRCEDIDTEDDWQRAEWLFRFLQHSNDRC